MSQYNEPFTEEGIKDFNKYIEKLTKGANARMEEPIFATKAKD